MNIYLPTRDECRAHVETTDAFFVQEKVIEGQNVELYDYRLASISDFFPEDGSNWTELRGLCFVQLADGTWKRNILMQKFFNINQTIGWMYDEVKHKRIDKIQAKEDGSIISFIKFENGNVRAKSKMSFDSDQALAAQKIYDTDENIKHFVDDQLRHDQVLIFELVGPENQIVLEYQNTELILLQVRNTHGHYHHNVNAFASYNVKVVGSTSVSPIMGSELDTLLHLKETCQDPIEGWVITFEDGQMAKIKTNRYMELHGLIGPDAFRENLLVQTILNGNIDDVIAQLVPGEKRDKLVELSEKVEHHFNHLVVEYKELRRKYFNDFKEVRRDFAIKHSKDRMFSGVIKNIDTSFRDVEKVAESAVKAYIERQCNSLGKAKEYLEAL